MRHTSTILMGALEAAQGELMHKEANRASRLRQGISQGLDKGRELLGKAKPSNLAQGVHQRMHNRNVNKWEHILTADKRLVANAEITARQLANAESRGMNPLLANVMRSRADAANAKMRANLQVDAADVRAAGDKVIRSGKRDTWLKENAKNIDDVALGGAGVLGVGLGAKGLHSHGYERGNKHGITEGIGEGWDTGVRQGASVASAMQPGDPGFLGRLGALFTGQQSGPGPDRAVDFLSQNREQLLAQLMAGR
jgi:flagellar biosynthesis/type III secretory pathway protein FliH